MTINSGTHRNVCISFINPQCKSMYKGYYTTQEISQWIRSTTSSTPSISLLTLLKGDPKSAFHQKFPKEIVASMVYLSENLREECVFLQAEIASNRVKVYKNEENSKYMAEINLREGNNYAFKIGDNSIKSIQRKRPFSYTNRTHRCHRCYYE